MKIKLKKIIYYFQYLGGRGGNIRTKQKVTHNPYFILCSITLTQLYCNQSLYQRAMLQLNQNSHSRKTLTIFMLTFTGLSIYLWEDLSVNPGHSVNWIAKLKQKILVNLVDLNSSQQIWTGEGDIFHLCIGLTIHLIVWPLGALSVDRECTINTLERILLSMARHRIVLSRTMITIEHIGRTIDLSALTLLTPLWKIEAEITSWILVDLADIYTDETNNYIQRTELLSGAFGFISALSNFDHRTVPKPDKYDSSSGQSFRSFLQYFEEYCSNTFRGSSSL